MRIRITFEFLCLSTILIFSAFADSNQMRNLNRKVMPWMCLERCGANSTDIQMHLKQIKSHLDVFTGVSFELFNLGPNSTLIINSNLSNFGPILVNYGVETYPIVSSYPYPPEFIAWMRQLFLNPVPFMDSVIKQLVRYDYTGVNIDFEPTIKGSQEDAFNYANFLTLFANELHKVNKKLTVDIAGWNPIWNWTLIEQSTVDKIFLMSTYAGDFDTFQESLEQAINEIGILKLGVGLETVNPNKNEPFTDQELQERFTLIEANNIHEIDIWDMPIPDNWWSFLDHFVHQ